MTQPLPLYPASAISAPLIFFSSRANLARFSCRGEEEIQRLTSRADSIAGQMHALKTGQAPEPRRRKSANDDESDDSDEDSDESGTEEEAEDTSDTNTDTEDES